MVWTNPKTWSAGEALTYLLMNEQLRDNMDFLFDRPEACYTLNEASNYATSLTTWADIDATNLALTFTASGSHIMTGFFGCFTHTAVAGRIHLDITVDGVREAGDDGLTMVAIQDTADRVNISFLHMMAPLSLASHTIKLQWKTSGAQAILYAGAGTANYDVHGQFWCHEI